jgi:hypothetical protein
MGFVSAKNNFILFRAALGVSQTHEWSTSLNQKSISKERTFDTTASLTELVDVAQILSMEIHKIVEKLSICYRTVTVKFKSSDFIVSSRSFAFLAPTKRLVYIIYATFKLINQEYFSHQLHVRLLGVKISNLVFPGESYQQSLLDYVIHEPSKKEEVF